MRVGWAWLDSCALTAGQRTSSSIDGRVSILACMVAELALTMEERRQAMVFMPGDVMSVGDRRSEKSRASAGAKTVQRFQEYAGRRLCELGDVQSRRAGETAKIEVRADLDRRHPSMRLLWFPLECGLPPCSFVAMEIVV